MPAMRIVRLAGPEDMPYTSFRESMLFPRSFMAIVYQIFAVRGWLQSVMVLVRHLRRDNGFHAERVVDEFKEVRLLRRTGVVHEKPRGDLSALCVKNVASVRATDAPPPRDHLPSVSVVVEKLDNAFHVHLASTEVFPVIVSACEQMQWRFQLTSAAALFVFA